MALIGHPRVHRPHHGDWQYRYVEPGGYHVALSLRRANALLVREGVSVHAITVIGSGEIVIWIVDARSSVQLQP